MGRWLKMLFAKISGIFGRKADNLAKDPDVMSAVFDGAIDRSAKGQEQMIEAVSAMMAVRADRQKAVEAQTEKLKKLENVEKGALAKAKKVVTRLTEEGKSQEEIKADEEYKRCMNVYNDAKSSSIEVAELLKEKQASLERQIKKLERRKEQIKEMTDQHNKLKSEKSESIADLVSSNASARADALFAEIDTGGEDKALQAAREAVKQVNARADLMSDLAGTDTKSLEDEFSAYAEEADASSDFDDLMFGNDTSTDTEEKEASQLPE